MPIFFEHICENETHTSGHLTCTHIHAHTYMHTHTCTHMHAHTYMHTRTCTHIRAHSYTHTYMHTHTHTCCCAHTYTHTHAVVLIRTHTHSLTSKQDRHVGRMRVHTAQIPWQGSVCRDILVVGVGVQLSGFRGHDKIVTTPHKRGQRARAVCSIY